MTAVRSCVLPGARHGELVGDAYACESCQRGLVRKLGEVEDYLAIVSAVPSRSGDFGPRRPGYGSAPPLRLDVVAMLDPRTEINGAGPDDVVDEVPNIGEDLAGWWRVVQEERHYRIVAGGQGTLPTAPIVVDLRTSIGWICEQPWVDEFAADITRVHGALRAVCGDAPPRAAGRCLDQACGGAVFRRSDDPRDPRLQCSVCRTTYDGFDLIRVGETA